MSLPIEDYALISDCRTGAMVGRDGSIDWLCFPRYDSASMFGALLGRSEHGRWLVAPSDETAVATRGYLDRTFVLATRWVTATGELEVLDFMPVGDHRSEVARRVRCLRGTVEVREELRVRFGYGASMPWMRQLERNDGSDLVAVAGPDAVVRRGPRLTATGPAARGDLHADGRAERRPHPHLVRVAPSGTGAGRRRGGAGRDRGVVAEVGGDVQPRGCLPRRGDALPAGAACPDPRGHRRHRCGSDDEPPRAARWTAQLGLPLRLAAGRVAEPDRVPRALLHQRGAPVAQLAAARDRRRPGRRADHVRAGRRAFPRRAGTRLAAGLPGRCAGAGGQCCVHPVPGGRDRDGHGGAGRRHGTPASRRTSSPGRCSGR